MKELKKMMTGSTWKEFDVMVNTSTYKLSCRKDSESFNEAQTISIEKPDNLESRFFTAVTSDELKGRGFFSTFA